VWAEQAIFTSLPRRGKGGYHLVSRSPGITDAEARALTTWSPSHGALIVDDPNRTSVNFHPLTSGRHALSRTCEGLAEYSGRGGRQLYTHALVVDDRTLKAVGNHPFLVYRDALALGYYHYRPEPEPTLPPVRLSALHAPTDIPYWAGRAEALGLAPAQQWVAQLASDEPLELAHTGDRALVAECLIGLLAPEDRIKVSFATSLRRSMVRPYQLVLVDES
jgi:hypothetical protein